MTGRVGDRLGGSSLSGSIRIRQRSHLGIRSVSGERIERRQIGQQNSIST